MRSSQTQKQERERNMRIPTEAIKLLKFTPSAMKMIALPGEVIGKIKD